MKLKEKHLLIVLAVVLLLAVAATVYYYRTRDSADPEEPTPKAPDDDDSPAPTATGKSILSSLPMGGGGGMALATAPETSPSLVRPAMIVAGDTPPYAAETPPYLAETPPYAAETPPYLAEQHQPESISHDGGLTGVGVIQEPAYGDEFPLKEGTQGPKVAQLQAYLVRNYGVQYPQGITSSFDGTTLKAVRKHLKRDTISSNFFHKVGMGR